MTSSPVEVSVVLPAYNEARRILSSLEQVDDHFRKRGFSYEIVVVDDGSTDDTRAVVEEAQAKYSSLRFMTNDRNRGKGFSVRHGVMEARGQFVLFSDADLSAPIEESDKLLNPLREERLELTLGSRSLDRRLIGIHQPWMREQSGRIFNLCVRWILGLNFADTQCGFKAFRRESLVPVFQRMRVMGFGFDPEMLFVAKAYGLRMREIPVRWNHAAGSKVSFVSDAILMFFDLIRIRWYNFRGCYRREV